MSNNRDDKFDGQDDSEYHFSDEEVTYEVESELPPKTATVTSSDQGGGVSRRSSRRILASFGVFLAIVFVVYKMVSGGTSAPPTDITAPAVATQKPVSPPAQAAPIPVVQAAAPATPATPAVAATQPAAAPVNQPTPSVVQSQPVSQQPAQTTPPAVANLPSVIPVQAPAPQGQSPAAAMSAYIEDKSPVLTATSQQVSSQMQSQSTQQLDEFMTQNKSMQTQIQTLNTRVADMEAQINQLVQVLTRRVHNNSAATGGSSNTSSTSSTSSMSASPAVQQARPEVRVAYNVQAIIPGRAWLKSDNGETLTVAEGDVIRNVGRVTKIDPYDGVVEINTGTKAVSLSYGNGG